jgi:hypothetical protein
VVNISEDFIVNKFYQYVGGPKKNRYTETYQGSCPICREGKSWLKKQRFFFIPKKNLCFCHNCGYSANPIKWVSDVSGVSVKEVLQEMGSEVLDISLEEPQIEIKKVSDTLPKDCINLFDQSQVDFYKNNKIVNKCVDFIKKRNLYVAVNKPKALYISLTDSVHKNRLVIPFFDDNDKIVYYQTRTILEADELFKPRYISKIGAEKSVFNINTVEEDSEYIFVFEGPLNSCFMKNGVAVGGIQENSYQLFTSYQEEQMNKYPFHKRIWILDSQWKDRAAFNKTKKLLEMKERVFMWPKDIGKICKDFNDITIKLDKNEISTDFVMKNII